MNNFKIIKKLVIISIAILVMPFSAFAVNDVSVSDLTYFELQTADTATLVTITADGGGQATNFDVESNYIDITLDNLSTITFKTNVSNRFFKITKQSGSDDYTVDPSCPTNVVTLTGTGAQVILRLQVLITDSCAVVTPPPPVVGGGGGGYIPPSITGSLTINNGAFETYSSNVTLGLSSASAVQMIVSNDQNFTNGVWENYSTSKSWILISGLGSRVVYTRFKDSGGRMSSVVSATILVKENIPEPLIESETCNVNCGHLTYDLYIINPDGSERHMDQTRWARKTILANGSLLVNFEDKGLDDNYNDVVVQINTLDCSSITVSARPSTASWRHQIKLKFFYDGILKDDVVLWSDSHLASANPINIDINSNEKVCADKVVVPVKPVVPVVPKTCKVDCSRLTYDLYIINPNGSIRDMNQTRWAKKKTLADGSLQVSFEDKGLDNNYKDVIVNLNIKDCSNIIASTLPSTAKWHHQIKLKVSYDGVLKDDITLIADDHLSPNKKTIMNINSNQNICTAQSQAISVTLAPKVFPSIKSKCQMSTTFTKFLNFGSNDLEVTPLQKLLQCLGYLPLMYDSNGHFGLATTEAVKKFQAAKGIVQAGYVGPTTREALNAYLAAPIQ